MKAREKIKGGYYLKARKSQEGWIAHAPPHVREIWDYFIHHANFKDHGKIKRGQLLTSYKDIQEGTHWMVGYRKEKYSKWQCEIAMKLLTKQHMVATTKTTRGMIVTVLNYEYYQNPENYENHNEHHKRTTREPQGTDTIRELKEESKEREDKTVPGPPNVPHQKIVDLYHEVLGTLPKVRIWDDGRKTLLRNAWQFDTARQDLDWWRRYFGYVKKSEFLMGLSEPGYGRERSFRADLEWLIRPTNMRKIIEGRYHEDDEDIDESQPKSRRKGYVESSADNRN